jgi:hypothetical protein
MINREDRGERAREREREREEFVGLRVKRECGRVSVFKIVYNLILDDLT